MMLAYAANRPVAGRRQSSPNALLFVISAHVALVAAVMSAKMDLPQRILREPPIKTIDFPPPAPAPPVQHNPEPTPIFTRPIPQPLPPLPPIDGPTVTTGPIDTGAVVLGGGGTAGVAGASNPIKLAPIRHEPRLLTPPSELKPPYPASKLASEEEAVLVLRLSIDDRGRVVGVEPIGRADRTFVDAARRHLIAHWRYSPATEDGRTISSSLTVTLRFMLDG